MSTKTTERLVRLQQCCRKSCSRIYPDDEMGYIAGDSPGHRFGVCPFCGNRDYFRMLPDGMPVRGRDQSHEKFDLNNWAPDLIHKKAGSRVRKELLAMYERFKSGEGPEFTLKRQFAIELGLVRHRAGELGLLKTMHAMQAATDAVGWEIAEQLEKATTKR